METRFSCLQAVQMFTQLRVIKCLCFRFVRWMCPSSSKPMRWSTTCCRMSCWTRPRPSTSTSELRSWRGPIRACDSRTSTCSRSSRYTHTRTLAQKKKSCLCPFFVPLGHRSLAVLTQVSHARVCNLESRVEALAQAEGQLKEQVSALEEEKKQLLNTITHLQGLLSNLGINANPDGQALPSLSIWQTVTAASKLEGREQHDSRTVDSLLHLLARVD